MIPGRRFHPRCQDSPDGRKIDLFVRPLPAGLSLVDDFVKIHTGFLLYHLFQRTLFSTVALTCAGRSGSWTAYPSTTRAGRAQPSGTLKNSLICSGSFFHRDVHHAAQSFSRRGQQHIFNQCPGCAVVHETIAIFVFAQRVLLLEPRQNYAGGFLDHAALPGIGDLEHFLLGCFGFLNPAGIGADELCQRQDAGLFRQRQQFPAPLVIGRWRLQPRAQNSLQHFLRDFPVLKLADTSPFFDHIIEFHARFPPFPG